MHTVSVIIPTYKRANNLLACLESIGQQSRQPEEVIIVDGDNSNDLESFLEKHLKVNFTYETIKSPPGLTRQRNSGIRRATQDIVLFLDDDVILDKNHIKEIVAVFNLFPRKIGGVSGLVEVKDIFTNRILKMFYQIYSKIFFLAHEGDGKFLPSGFATWVTGNRCNNVTTVEFLFGCNMAFKREVILKFGFDENLYRYMHMEDDDIAYRISRKLQNYWTPFARLRHMGPQSKRNDYIRAQALFRNHAYLHRKNFPQTLSNKLIFLWAMIGWINLEFFHGLVKLDLSRFLGMISNFNFLIRRENE